MAEGEILDAHGRKQAIHFGAPDRPLFGFYHPPKGGAWRGVGVVLVSPLGTDHTRSERTYRHLAERLAEAGFACLRFDLFGTGDSGGDALEPGLVSAWIYDVGIAADELRARSGAGKIALAGLRLGATLAMLHAAARGDVDSLVLWSPCVSGAGFVNEVTRLHKVYARIEPQLAEAPKPTDDGDEALGVFFPRAFIGELSKVDLLQTTRRPARRTLVIDGGGVASRDALVTKLGELDAAPELRSHPGHKFLMTVSHRSQVPDDVIASISGWLESAYPRDTEPATPPTRPGAPGPSNERPFVFGAGKRLFGILTPASRDAARPGRPPIVIANAGCVNRSGPHRTSARMARRWAALGFDVLRVDLAGIGDSPFAPGTVENITYPPSGMEDLDAAIQALDAPRAIVAGLCSGGDYAYQLGAHHPKVAAALIINPRTFCVLDLAAVESADGAPPTTSVDEVPRALRAMAERGVDTLLLVSKNDPGVAYVDAHAGDAMRALAGLKGFQRVTVDGSDHTFTPVVAQAHVSDVLSDYLRSKFSSQP